MTKEEFDLLDSNGQIPCPVCGLKYTEPYPGCGCPSSKTGYGTRHINEYHHNCENARKREEKRSAEERDKELEWAFTNMI